MRNSKRRNTKVERAGQTTESPVPSAEQLRDTPAFLVRLIGPRQAKALAARTNIRHRHD